MIFNSSYWFQLLDTKWQSSAKDVIIFRKCLLNPVTALQFRRYVSVKDISNKEDKLENDVLFWLEVQRFKVSTGTYSIGSSFEHAQSLIVIL